MNLLFLILSLSFCLRILIFSCKWQLENDFFHIRVNIKNLFNVVSEVDSKSKKSHWWSPISICHSCISMKHRNQRYQRRQVILVDKENNLNIIRHIVGIVDFQNCLKHILHIQYMYMMWKRKDLRPKCTVVTEKSFCQF